ncbi:MAG: ribose-phosphate pyrophosphokinase [Lachnospiraceae bacterium]|jgi:ribose-phosphate pyrophosphokinase|nr:ribose-phosphate pyrophosphokinase [Lachnospiraceae bacterium]MDE6998687.1 ribose-phosphate pyrophosphokinase [Lachnospiraceae bacterium]
MSYLKQLKNAMPVAPLKLLVLNSAAELGNEVNNYLVDFRSKVNNVYINDPAFQGYAEQNYLFRFDTPRFNSGEGKAVLEETVRGKDLFILVDVCNHSLTYKMNGYTNHMSPDDHYQDLKRVIAATNGKAHRISVIMPFLYEGRQHRRNGRESLDCAYAFKELTQMGVRNFITFDAHDPRIQNAAPLNGFDNFTAHYQFTRALLRAEKDLILDKDHIIVISPDEGALDRAIYFSTVIGADTGMFYKRRDYTRIVNGKNPIVAHEFLGNEIEGKDIIIIDDMISSGDSMIDTARQLKKMKAKRVFICTTFGIFTNGLAAFDKAYEERVFDRVITTNLSYRPPELLTKPYYLEADMSKFLASIIDFLNHDLSIEQVTTPTEKIQNIIELYLNGNEIFKI